MDRSKGNRASFVGGAKRLGFQVDLVDSDYSRGLIRGARAYCEAHGISLLVFAGRSFGWPYGFEYQNTAVYGHVRGWNLDGLVIVTGTQCNYVDPEEFKAYIDSLAGMPVVSVAVPLPGRPCVASDNDAGLRSILAHLVDRHGAKRIAVLKGPEGNEEARRRFEVYRSFLSERGIPFDPSIALQGDFSVENSVNALMRHLEDRAPDFDALLCLNDTMAIGCLGYFADRGIRVPEDVIVTGFDDIVRSRYESPSLTTVCQDLEAQGRIACELAHALLEGKDIPPLTMIPTRAVFRQSCGCVDGSSIGIETVEGSDTPAPYAQSLVSFVARDWIRVQDDIVLLRQYLSRLISVLAIEDLLDDLRESLEVFRIASCAIVIYDAELRNPRGKVFELPHRATLALGYDEATPREGRFVPVAFSPRDALLPEGTFSDRPRSLVVTALYYREEQLGYIVYEPGTCAPSIYETLCVQLSSTIRSALVFAAKQAAEERLNEALFELEAYNKRLSDISQTDELTGLYNRRGFLSLGQQSMDLALRMGKNGLVVFGDMDGLKRINDTWGHDAGDRAILAMAHVLRKTFRSLDVLARLGGDEFAIVAVDISSAFVETLRERMNRWVEAYNETSGEPFRLSISLGAVEFSGEHNRKLEGLLSLADSVLYEEKRRKKEGK